MFSFFKRGRKTTQSAETKPTANLEAQADALITQGNQLEDMGRIQEALDLYNQSLTLIPNYWRAYMNQAIAYDALDSTEQAIELYRKAYNANPNVYATCYNLGRALDNTQGTDGQTEAQQLIQDAIKLKPDAADAWFILANIQEQRGQTKEALNSISHVIKLQPENYAAKITQARYLTKLDRTPEALDILNAIVEENSPDFKYDAIMNITSILHKQGKTDQTLPLLEKLCLSKEIKHIRTALMLQLYVDQEDNRLEKLAFDNLKQVLPSDPYYNNISENKRIHIGFISPDLYGHAISYFVEPLFTYLDKNRFEIFVYYTGGKTDYVTQRLKSLTSNWHHLYGRSHAKIAHQIRNDKIQILVDLAGHSSNGCEEVLAKKPAPYIVTWLGYLASTGMESVNYRLTDIYSDPIGLTEELHTEKLIRLPVAQWCYQIQEHTRKIPVEMPYRDNGYITFGSFNQVAKLSERCLELWARLLQAVPDANLRVAAISNKEAKDRILQIMTENNVDKSRIEFQGMENADTYFQSYNFVDIALDSYPYTGGTTTCDALAMGVPVLTLAGKRSVSRSAASLLHTLGHPEWVAENDNDFIENALALVERVKSSDYNKNGLRGEFTSSVLTDGRKFAEHFGEAMQTIIEGKI
jgi:tetratricopeptide repeat protein